MARESCRFNTVAIPHRHYGRAGVFEAWVMESWRVIARLEVLAGLVAGSVDLKRATLR